MNALLVGGPLHGSVMEIARTRRTFSVTTDDRGSKVVYEQREVEAEWQFPVALYSAVPDPSRELVLEAVDKATAAGKLVRIRAVGDSLED